MGKASDVRDHDTSELRRQLILSQVRIMELEDVREETEQSLKHTRELLASAQNLADQKAEEQAHLENVQRDMEEQVRHLRHIQHVTNEALEGTRKELAAAAEEHSRLTDEMGELNGRVSDLEALLQEQTDLCRRREEETEAVRKELADRENRIRELDEERRTMKSSRSWRWTKPVRAIERLLDRWRSGRS